MKKVILTKNAPAPIGPYNQAIVHGNTIYVSGQIAIDPSSGEMKMSSIEEETHMVLTNLKAVLEAGGSSLDQVLKTTILMSSMDHYGTINSVYGEYFNENAPAREAVAVKTLPKNVNVEISAIAAV
ncbi:MAG: RidA family protein [Flavobacteriales bacterium]|nr:RidA family protein [Flavobacteriales bacterium]